jgi:glutamate racemase
MNETRIRKEIGPALERDADVIVLGCTHYHWIEQEIKAICKDRAQVIQPETAVVAQLKHVLGLL